MMKMLKVTFKMLASKLLEQYNTYKEIRVAIVHQKRGINLGIPSQRQCSEYSGRMVRNVRNSQTSCPNSGLDPHHSYFTYHPY